MKKSEKTTKSAKPLRSAKSAPEQATSRAVKNSPLWATVPKIGRPRKFKTAEELWNACTSYFEWCDEHPWPLPVSTKHGIANLPAHRPYTLTGLCVYLNANEEYWRVLRKTITEEDYCGVIARVEAIIEAQQFEGAAVGAFNANIIARRLGLADRQELTGRDGERLLGDRPLTSERKAEILAEFGQ